MGAITLDDYLRRVGYAGEARADLATLRALHRAHVHTVPFENLDVQLKRPVTLDPAAIYDKIVNRRRGGWCYELNGLLGWALEQIGFRVMRMSAGVMRESLGDAPLGNHLCLLVRLEQDYLVDVGFGSSLLEPLPLTTTRRADSPYIVGLAPLADGYWRFTEELSGTAFTYDFKPEPADESLLAEKCQQLQSASDSPFVLNLVAKRRVGARYLTLRGRMFSQVDATGETKRLLNSADECAACLHDEFGLDVSEVRSIWPAIRARHAVLFGDDAE